MTLFINCTTQGTTRPCNHAYGSYFVVFCCGLSHLPISLRVTSSTLVQHTPLITLTNCHQPQKRFHAMTSLYNNLIVSAIIQCDTTVNILHEDSRIIPSGIVSIILATGMEAMTTKAMGLLPDTQNRGLLMRRECRERFPHHRLQRKPLVSDPGMHHGTCVTHVPWCMSGSLNCGGGGKRSRHSRRMRNSQFFVSGKRPMVCSFISTYLGGQAFHTLY